MPNATDELGHTLIKTSGYLLAELVISGMI
jgi:hypothetical protein